MRFGTLCVVALVMGQTAWADTPTFNSYIKQAVEKVYLERSGGGYNRHRSFTQDLAYGPAPTDIIPATRDIKGTPVDPPFKADGKNPTMCVAAVAEVIVEAIGRYAADHAADPAASPYAHLSLDQWRSGKLSALRANLYMYGGSSAGGTADALELFGLGRQKTFDQLKPFDFINFNRVGKTGHAVVFINYITASGPAEVFSNKVIGFRYFSAQGEKRSDGGFGYRDGYFDGSCPGGKDDDCQIIKGYKIRANGTLDQNQRLLNTGEMYLPTAWTVEQAAKARLDKLSQQKATQQKAKTAGISLRLQAQFELDRELQPDDDRYADGSE